MNLLKFHERDGFQLFSMRLYAKGYLIVYFKEPNIKLSLPLTRLALFPEKLCFKIKDAASPNMNLFSKENLGNYYQ